MERYKPEPHKDVNHAMTADTRAPDSTRAYAAVDLGASSGRVVIGAFCNGVWRSEEIHRFENGLVQSDAGPVWDLVELFSETITGLRESATRCAERGWRLAGIGIDSWGVDWVLMRSNGDLELPGRSYRGAIDPAPGIAARRASAAEVYAISGVPDHAINSALRLGVLAQQREFAGEQLLFLPDLWVYWLTGTVGTDATIASTSQLLDARTGEFAPQLVAAHALEGLTLPSVAAVGSVAGYLTEDLRETVGLTQEVAVYRVAGHDTAAAFAFADPADPLGMEGLISSGTWSLVGAVLPDPITTPKAARLGFTNERGAEGTLLLRNLTGLWMLQECVREWSDDPAADLSSLLAAVETREYDQRTFDTSAPELLHAGDMEMRVRQLCARAGRPLDDTKESVVHAIIDSLAATYAAGIAAVEELTGRTARRIRLVGGGSRNARLCQLTADLTGREVLAGPTEASALGNIAIQAHASGVVGHAAEVFANLEPGQIKTYSATPTDRSEPAKERHT